MQTYSMLYVKWYFCISLCGLEFTWKIQYWIFGGGPVLKYNTHYLNLLSFYFFFTLHNVCIGDARHKEYYYYCRLCCYCHVCWQLMERSTAFVVRLPIQEVVKDYFTCATCTYTCYVNRSKISSSSISTHYTTGVQYLFRRHVLGRTAIKWLRFWFIVWNACGCYVCMLPMPDCQWKDNNETR